MRSVYTVNVREDLTYHGLGVPYYNRNHEWKEETIGYVFADELNGSRVMATSDETGDVYVELPDKRVMVINARNLDFFKDGVKQEVKK